MRNGNRISGRLIGLRDGVFEFEEDRGNRRGVSFASSRWTCAPSSSIRMGPERSTAATERPSPSAGRPRGLREREVDVSARNQWTDTGINVRNGQTLYFEASGRDPLGHGSAGRSRGREQLAAQSQPADSRRVPPPR